MEDRWESLKGEREVLAELARAITVPLPAITDEDPNRTKWTVAGSLAISLAEVTNSIVSLHPRSNFRAIFALSRVAFETASNTAFVLATSADVAERAMRHAAQKSFRDLNRVIRIGDDQHLIQWVGDQSFLERTEIQGLLAEFTTKSGAEDRRWVDLEMIERVEVISQIFGRDASRGFRFGLILYRQASELIHGTYYGAIFPLGVFDPVYQGPEDTDLFQFSYLSMAYFVLAQTFCSVLCCMAIAFDDPRASEEAERLSKKAHEASKNKPPAKGRGVGGWRMTPQ